MVSLSDSTDPYRRRSTNLSGRRESMLRMAVVDTLRQLEAPARSLEPPAIVEAPQEVGGHLDYGLRCGLEVELTGGARGALLHPARRRRPSEVK